MSNLNVRQLQADPARRLHNEHYRSAREWANANAVDFMAVYRDAARALPKVPGLTDSQCAVIAVMARSGASVGIRNACIEQLREQNSR